MAADPKPLILVDGSSYLFRAFHALPPLTSPAGEPTGAIYGVINMLRKLMRDYPESPIAVVFDPRGPTFRNELYADYKANRPPMPDELAGQIEPLFGLIRALGLPLLIEDGVEADDVIGTLAHEAEDRDCPVIISTGDKDLAQLVNGHVTLINTMNGERLDREGVVEKFGVPPERIIDYLALVGDTSDNIPGVHKCGPKTALKWLARYDSLDGVMEHADEIGGKIGEYLRESLEQLPLSRRLVTIHREVPLDVHVDEIERGEPDTARLRELYAEMGFRSWREELENDAGPDSTAGTADKRETEYAVVLDEAGLEGWLERLEAAELFAFDTETTDLDYMNAEIVGVSVAVEPFEAAYIPLAHVDPDTPGQLDRETVLERLRPLLEDAGRPKLGQNLKYDASVLANHGIRLRGIVHDTMLESYCLDATATRHDMDSLARKYLGETTTQYEDVAGKGKKQLRFDQVPVATAAPYAAEDADITLRLHRHLWPRLEAEPALRDLYREVEMPLVPVLSRMERTGVMIDAERLRTQGSEIAERMAELERAAFDCAGRSFKLGSTQQLQAILFDELGLPVIRKTPGGKPSTAEDVLEKLAEEGHELPRLILDYRGLSKLKSTYTDRLPERINPRTGRVHTSYHQAVTATGRLSSSEPNLQNIPIRSEQGRRIRQAFVAPEGCRLLAADYSQIELRIMAHLSGDRALLAAFAEGRDIHAATAGEIFATAPEAVTGEQRRAAKAINFGLIYGMSAFGLARQLGIERTDAQAYVDRYFERYPGVATYMEDTRERAREQGYVETVFGRRLYIPEIRSRNGARRQYAERTAINAPMQGTAADLIKKAMLAVDDWLEGERTGVRMVMQVHDELVFEVPADGIEANAARIAELMTGVAELDVPLEVETGVGDNWDEAH